MRVVLTHFLMPNSLKLTHQYKIRMVTKNLRTFKFVFIVTIQPLEDQNKQSKLIFEALETQGTQ